MPPGIGYRGTKPTRGASVRVRAVAPKKRGAVASAPGRARRTRALPVTARAKRTRLKRVV